MRRIAIVSEGPGGEFPIPNVNGGAVETWITDLIRQNETVDGCRFDGFSCYSKEAKKYRFKHTKIRYFRTLWIEQFAFRAWNYLVRNLCGRPSFRLPYNWKVAHFTDWKKYDYILVENGMAIYEEIVKRPGTANKLIYHMRNDLEYVSRIPWAERSDVRTRLVGQSACEVLTVSRYIRDRFLSVQPTEHIRVFYNCVDTERYSKTHIKNRRETQKKYGISEEDVVFLYSGRVMEEKGVLEAAKAFAKVAELCPNAKFIVAGGVRPAEYGEKLHSVLDRFGGRAVFTGKIPPYEMQSIYGIADLVVAPTLDEEAFGMIVLEAMSMELPIIITDSGGMPEIVTEECAFIARRGENLVDELAEAMVRLYNDPQLRTAMGKKGRERIMNTYDFRKEFLHRRMMDLFDELDRRKDGDKN